MPLLLRPIATRFFLFMYLLGIVSSIVTIPNWKGAQMYGNAPWELLVDVYLLSAVVCLIPAKTITKTKTGFLSGINLRLVVKALIYCVMYPLYIIDTFCFVKFGATLNPSMLLLLGETNAGEATEFFQNYLSADILLSEVGVIMLVPLCHVMMIGMCRMLKFKMPKRKLKMPIRLAIDAVILALLAYAAYPQSYENKMLYKKTMLMQTIGEVEHSLAYNPHTEMYQPPMRLTFAIRSNQLIAKQLDNLMATLDKAEVDSCDMKSTNIVLIIGESFNKRHAQLYGYDKKNMPNQVRLEKSGLLTKLDDVIAPWNLTSFVFKHLMTTYCVGDTADWCDYPLFCQLFRQAGYRVTFLTNQFLPQAKEAVYDFSGGFFINNEKLSEEQFDRRNEKLHVFDEGLLQDYDNLNENDNEKLNSSPAGGGQVGALTIFHLMGQHVSYRIRCPNSKKRWGADTYPNDMDMPAKKRKLMADYDNAVWYNDSVVNQIVERFKKEDAVIIYLSDHGEEVFGPGARHFCGRMHDAVITKRLADEEFRIPMWIYCTPKYRRNHPEVFRAIKEAKGKKFMTDATSHLLLGLAGIHTKYYRPDYDLLSTAYNAERKRIIKNTVDYDTLK